MMHGGGGIDTVTISRRRFMRGAVAGLSAAAFGGGLAAGPRGPARAGTYLDDRERKLAIHNLWTEEHLDTVYWRDGEYLDGALTEFDYLLRDHRNGREIPIFYGVLDQLFFIRKALRTSAPIGLISGFRSSETNEWLSTQSEHVARNSLHTFGMAADFRMSDVPAHAVWKTAASLGMGGSGYYAASGFVHVDAGPVRQWSRR